VGELVHETFRAFVARHFGAAGRAWLDSLPKARAAASAEWELEVGRELNGGVLAWVLEARTPDGRDAVLKLAGPWDRPRDEIAALRRWAGGPAPRLLHADPDRGALLLERIRPGTPADDAHAADVAPLLEALHVDPPAGTPALATVVRQRVALAVEQERARPERAATALETLEKLEQDSPPSRLLHGDFDDRNILRCEVRGLVAIDPLPAAGDPAYDAAYWAHANRRPGARERAEAIAAALGLDPLRVRRWLGVIAVHG
jgi:streptomycin 6-kinase